VTGEGQGGRIAEQHIRRRRFGPRQRLRVDLHGVALFGPGNQHRAIRWEWIEDITGGDAVVVRSAGDAITIPAGTFGLAPPALAERLEAARSIVRRAEVIAELTEGAARSS
jgi:hypothetical protein